MLICAYQFATWGWIQIPDKGVAALTPGGGAPMVGGAGTPSMRGKGNGSPPGSPPAGMLASTFFSSLATWCLRTLRCYSNECKCVCEKDIEGEEMGKEEERGVIEGGNTWSMLRYISVHRRITYSYWPLSISLRSRHIGPFDLLFGVFWFFPLWF